MHNNYSGGGSTPELGEKARNTANVNVNMRYSSSFEPTGERYVVCTDYMTPISRNVNGQLRWQVHPRTLLSLYYTKITPPMARTPPTNLEVNIQLHNNHSGGGSTTNCAK